MPHPRKINVAVPANLRCGQPEHDRTAGIDPSWAPLTYTFGGIWEIVPQALEEAAETLLIVDAREPDEYAGAMGHIPGSRPVPLGELELRAAEIAEDTRPVVAVCRSGARSAQAVAILQRAGFRNVANLAGGMLRWRAEGHAAEGGRE